MKGRLIACSVLIAMIIAALSPVLLDESDALDSDDFIINVIPGGTSDQDIYVTLGNGESGSWDIYVVNNSDNILAVSFGLTNDTKFVNVDAHPNDHPLDPRSSGGTGYYSRESFKLTVDLLADSMDEELVDLNIRVTQINSDDPSEIGEYIDTHVKFHVEIKSVYDAGQYNKFLGLIKNDLPSPFNSPWVPCIVSIVFWLLLTAVLCKLIVPKAARYLDSQTPGDDQKKFEKALSRLITAIVFVVSLVQSLDILGATAAHKALAESIAWILLIILSLVLAWKIYLVVVENILRKFEEEEDSTVDMSLMPLMTMIGKIVFWIAGIASILSRLGVDLGGILISAGVVSLGITMGAQNVLSQFFSGIVILMTRPFKKGDFLKINGNVYIVKKVKIMFTEFLGWDKDMIITMPNNAVTAATIINLTKDDEAYRLYIYFPVAYKSDLKKVEKVMLDVANNSPVVLHDNHAEPNVRLTSFMDSGMEIRLGVTVKDFNGNITAASSLRMAVYQAFLENDIEVPYNRVEVDMLNDCFRGERRPGDMVED